MSPVTLHNLYNVLLILTNFIVSDSVCCAASNQHHHHHGSWSCCYWRCWSQVGHIFNKTNITGWQLHTVWGVWTTDNTIIMNEVWWRRDSVTSQVAGWSAPLRPPLSLNTPLAAVSSSLLPPTTRESSDNCVKVVNETLRYSTFFKALR